MSSNVFRMSPESRIQITVKLPSELHSSLSQAIQEGKYQSMTAAIITALEKELQEHTGMSKDLPNQDSDIQRLTLELQKNVSEMSVMHKTFEDSLTNVRAQLETENKSLKDEIEKIQERHTQDITGYKENIKALNVEIARLKEVLSNAPDPGELIEARTRIEGLQMVLEERNKRIEEINSHYENISSFANYFKSNEPKLLSSPAAEKKSLLSRLKFW